MSELLIFTIGVFGGFGIYMAMDILSTGGATWLCGVLKRHIDRKISIHEDEDSK